MEPVPRHCPPTLGNPHRTRTEEIIHSRVGNEGWVFWEEQAGVLGGCRRWLQQPRYRGQHVLRYFLPWLPAGAMLGRASAPKKLCAGGRAAVARWDVRVEWACAEGGRPCAGPAAPPLCITLYYGYRATDGWRWKQPDGTACSWRRRVSAAAHLARCNTGCPGQPRQFAAANALLLSLVKRSTTVSRSCARWTRPRPGPAAAAISAVISAPSAPGQAEGSQRRAICETVRIVIALMTK
jgi:hypothetical protein